MLFTLFSFHGEQKDGPQLLERFDPKTGVTLAAPGSLDFKIWVRTNEPLPASRWERGEIKVSEKHAAVVMRAFSYIHEKYPGYVFPQMEWDSSASVDEPSVIFWLDFTDRF